MRAKLLSSGREWLSDVMKQCVSIVVGLNQETTVKVKFSHNVLGKKMPGTIKGDGGSICEVAVKPDSGDHL